MKKVIYFAPIKLINPETGMLHGLPSSFYGTNYTYTHIHFFIDRQPWWARSSSLLRIHDRTQAHHNRQNCLPNNTQHSQQTDIHAPRLQWNPQSQRANGPRPTP